ncbi:MAG: hypothetical protein WBO58_10445, partial [Gammaproteobacteria bacterium]
MNLAMHYCRTLTAAARPLPQVIRKPALLKLWLFKPVRTRIFLFAGLLIFLMVANSLSQTIVDAWHPLEQNSFKTGVMELLNSPKLRKLQNLREVRYWQLLSVFWLIGLSVTSVILLRDLPRSIREAERISADLKRQSSEVREINPLLCETLNTSANNLRLDTKPPDQPVATVNAGPAKPPADIAKTKVGSSSEQKVRFIGPNQRYRIDKALASGGAGIVYQAEDTVLGRKVALKELLEDVATDEEQAERFKSEARA